LNGAIWDLWPHCVLPCRVEKWWGATRKSIKRRWLGSPRAACIITCSGSERSTFSLETFHWPRPPALLPRVCFSELVRSLRSVNNPDRLTYSRRATRLHTSLFQFLLNIYILTFPRFSHFFQSLLHGLQFIIFFIFNPILKS
jgi:hypothetical protein